MPGEQPQSDDRREESTARQEVAYDVAPELVE